MATYNVSFLISSTSLAPDSFITVAGILPTGRAEHANGSQWIHALTTCTVSVLLRGWRGRQNTLYARIGMGLLTLWPISGECGMWQPRATIWRLLVLSCLWSAGASSLHVRILGSRDAPRHV